MPLAIVQVDEGQDLDELTLPLLFIVLFRYCWEHVCQLLAEQQTIKIHGEQSPVCPVSPSEFSKADAYAIRVVCFQDFPREIPDSRGWTRLQVI